MSDSYNIIRNSNKERTAHALKHFRTKKKLKQYELADLIPCTPSLISQYENGYAIPSRQFIKCFVKALRLTAAEHRFLLTSAGYER